MIFGSRRRLTTETTRAQAVVVGSGAGGAVVARELAEAGYDVLVLEEGRRVPPHVYSQWTPTQVVRRMWRLGGTTVAVGLGDSPTVSISGGMCVGGSSLMTGGVCFRIPSSVHKTWVDRIGVRDLSEDAMRPHYERVEAMSHVEVVPESMRSRSTVRFGEGAQRRGLTMKPIRRNTQGCCGCSRCNFGCPHLAKLAVDLTYLPRAEALGAQIRSNHRVESLILDGDRVRGVRGMVLDEVTRTPTARFEVRADLVVLTAGTLHTPLLLLKHRIGRRSRQVGRNLTLHPAFRMTASFDDVIEPWKGALQSAYIDEDLGDERLILISAFAPLNIVAGGFPGVGPEFMARVRKSPHIATFGGMVHDDPGGRVRRSLGREPFITYRLSPRDKAAMVHGMRLLAECFFDAGARSVQLPVLGQAIVEDPDGLRDLTPETLNAQRLECLSFHPLGTCRLGTDPRRAVVDPQGRVYGVRGLWVADGSVLPTSVGVNTQIPIMTMATRIAFEIIADQRNSA